MFRPEPLSICRVLSNPGLQGALGEIDFLLAAFAEHASFQIRLKKSRFPCHRWGTCSTKDFKCFICSNPGQCNGVVMEASFGSHGLKGKKASGWRSTYFNINSCLSCCLAPTFTPKSKASCRACAGDPLMIPLDFDALIEEAAFIAHIQGVIKILGHHLRPVKEGLALGGPHGDQIAPPAVIPF